MPGNELGDRVHNLFAQNNSLNQSQGAEANWPVLNNNISSGSQSILHSNNKNYNNPQGSDTDRGQSSYPFHVTHGLNFTQSNLRPERSNLNGYTYENQFHHTRQNEANFSPVDTNSYQSHQGGGPPNIQANSAPFGSFNLFGSQHQLSHQQVNDTQQLQQQLMSRKMQELHQRQQQIHQIDLRQQNQVNGSINANYPWTGDINTNLPRGSSTMQGSSPNGFVFLPNVVPQQVDDQSLYGVPVSSSSGLTVNQMSNSSHSLQAKFQNENMFGHGINNMGGLSSVQGNAPREFFGRQELPVRPETPNEDPKNEASLDPIEEKILFGSDDNIWSNTLDNGEFLDGFTSLQSGSWSALMQSAVAETSSGDIDPHEEWNGLFLDCQPSAIHNKNIKHIPSDDVNTNDVMEFDLLGHKLENEPGQRSVPSFEEGSEGSQIYRNGTQLSLEAEKKALEIPPPWGQGQSENIQQSNGVNACGRMPTGGESVLNILESEKVSHNSQSNQMMVMQGAGAYVNSFWKTNSISNSPVESGPVKSPVGNPEVNNRMAMSNETSPFVQNNYLLMQWKNANYSANSHQVIEHNKGLDLLNGNCDLKETSSDSHRSNLSHLTSGGAREMESTTQLARKISDPRKFQYHQMGNSDGDSNYSFGMNHPTNVKGMCQNNLNFDQSKFTVQAPRNSTVTEKKQSSEFQEDNNTPDKKPFNSGFPGYAPNTSIPLSKRFGSHTQNKSSSSSQNVIELLHKVDRSSDPGAMVQFSSSEYNIPTQPPEQEKFFDGSVEKRQSSPYQGFGLQLGPPSSSSSQKSQAPINSIQSFPFPNGGSKGEFENNRSAGPQNVRNENSLYKKQENFQSIFNSNASYVSNHLQNQQLTSVSGKVNLPNDEHEVLTRDDQVLNPIWTNKGGGDFPSELSSIYMNPYGVDGENQNLMERSGQFVSSRNIDPSPKMKESSPGKPFSIENSSGNSASPEKDIEAFGRSLKPNNQMEALEDAETDPSIRVSKRTKGTNLKDGIMLNIHEGNQTTPLRPEKMPFTLGECSSVLDTLNSEEKVPDTLQGCSSALVSNGQLSYPHLVILSPKKRKSPTSELQPWHKEISGGSQCVWTLSVAESDWTKAANRLPKKVEDDADFIKDGPPLHRSARRLMLTTQLMQQIFRPPPADILSVDANSNKDSVIYAVSRIALGDACSTVSLSSDSLDLLSGKGKQSETRGDQKLGIILEELMGRASNLENDFLRLDNNASILDLRVGCQDLERFSVMTRFIKFHGRGQNETPEAADKTPPTQKPMPQRYVTALPMPRTISDRVQCLSL